MPTRMISSFLHRHTRRLAIKLYQRGVQQPILNCALYATYLFQFWNTHRRLPLRPNTRFNDFLFSLKAGSEIGAGLRRLITDKEFGKVYIESKLGVGTTPTTLSVLKTVEEIDNYVPTKYPLVFKPTHSSGRVAIVFSQSDYQETQRTIKEWLNHDYFVHTLEKNYVGLEKKVIAEGYIGDSFVLEGSVHCLTGDPRIITLIDRNTHARQSFDLNKMPLGVSLHYPLREFEPQSWDFLPRLLAGARLISAEFSYIRVDFYTDTRNVLFGELTNLPAGANGRFSPDHGEDIFSQLFFKPRR